ncbi:ribosomal protein S18 acetylase RimI-like enzyme [Parabacteroides sp. PFB2-10]|uniref:GNAT family N-acetyltransferase n=1 Tax=Parabacteroides sp. PFB2-10 TaxID=1742405 RepID=UPI00247618E9|nr:GNAT family N-acetyltransferase [Parabacteroides sp. PFB2-10]MDH6312618.1 ribosomal protein S18 acetylase RimI-like enzyme [Parabacteroides sp. PFB2-10]
MEAIKYQHFKGNASLDLEAIEKTYNESFPPAERRDFSLVRKLLREEPDFDIIAFYREEEYLGFISFWLLEDFYYVEHFAIDPSARNGGIGGEVMRHLLSNMETPVVLEVELPTDELSRRRIGFYERLGFSFDPTPYQQPPYRPGEDWVDLRLMAYGDIDLKKDFERVRDAIHQKVYGMKPESGSSF